MNNNLQDYHGEVTTIHDGKRKMLVYIKPEGYNGKVLISKVSKRTETKVDIGNARSQLAATICGEIREAAKMFGYETVYDK